MTNAFSGSRLSGVGFGARLLAGDERGFGVLANKSVSADFRGTLGYAGARLTLVVMGVVFALGGIEVGIRAMLLLRDSSSLEMLREEQNRRGAARPREPYRKLALGDRIRVSATPGIVYEWKPGIRSLDKLGNRHTINQMGFRGPQVELDKPPGTIRVVGIGDSVMYGNGVADDETYLAVLSTMLNEKVPGARWEVINTAVPGYNTRMEVETLRTKGLAYKPDLVMLHFVPNDVDLPPFALKGDDPYDGGRSYLFEALKNALRGREARALGRVSKKIRRSDEAEVPVPPEYLGSTGRGGVRQALADLAALRDLYGFDILLIAGGRNPFLMAACEGLEIPFFSLRKTRADFQREHGGNKALARRLLTVSPDDKHPSALGHRVIAQALFDELAASGRVDALLRRAGIEPDRASMREVDETTASPHVSRRNLMWRASTRRSPASSFARQVAYSVSISQHSRPWQVASRLR